MASEPIDTELTGCPVCPACGSRDDCWWECSDLKHDGDCTIQECGNCGASYDTHMYVDVSFTTVLRHPASDREGSDGR